MPPKNRQRLAFYSSIPCAPTFGGPLQIYRHFRERSDFELIDLNPEEEKPWDGLLPRGVVTSPLFRRLCRTRLYPWLIYASSHTNLRAQARELAAKIKECSAVALVTVAYGRRCHVCRRAAKIAGVPLVTFYHDWWPDLVIGKTPRTLALMDRQFRNLARDSGLIFPVSESLLQELGGHPNAVVLPPIPATFPSKCQGLAQSLLGDPPDSPQPKRLVYAGTLQGAYGEMIRALAREMLSQRDCGWILRCYGVATEWPEEERAHLAATGVYGGQLAQGPELAAALSGADALLVVMDFLPEHRRRVRTSFPSKILDYLHFRKPIIAWGSDDCTAVKWITESTLGHSVTAATPKALVDRLRTIRASKPTLGASDGIEMLIPAEYSAESIHASLAASLKATLTSD